MTTIIDSLLSGADPDKHLNGKPCACGHCPQCLSGRTGSHRNWRDRRNARNSGVQSPGKTAAGYENEAGRGKGSPIGLKPIPGQTSRIIPVRGAHKQALVKKWAKKAATATDPRARDRYSRYADTVRNSDRPLPDQSEKDLLPLFHRSRMLFYKPNRMIQVLNFNVRSPYALYRLLGRRRKLTGRLSLPLIVLDIRGQEKSAGDPYRLMHRVARASGYPAGQLKVVTW